MRMMWKEGEWETHGFRGGYTEEKEGETQEKGHEKNQSIVAAFTVKVFSNIHEAT